MLDFGGGSGMTFPTACPGFYPMALPLPKSPRRHSSRRPAQVPQHRLKPRQKYTCPRQTPQQWPEENGVLPGKNLGHITHTLRIPRGPNPDRARIVGRENQNSPGLKYTVNFSQSAEARFVGEHAVYSIESHHDCVKGR